MKSRFWETKARERGSPRAHQSLFGTHQGSIEAGPCSFTEGQEGDQPALNSLQTLGLSLVVNRIRRGRQVFTFFPLVSWDRCEVRRGAPGHSFLVVPGNPQTRAVKKGGHMDESHPRISKLVLTGHKEHDLESQCSRSAMPWSAERQPQTLAVF